MSEYTPSQAEGERDDDKPNESAETRPDHGPPRTTPSQAEGERDEGAEAERALPDNPDRYARARSEEEPGAHSGAESQAHSRIVPGTASAAEGYGPPGGTADDEPLAQQAHSLLPLCRPQELIGSGRPGARRVLPVCGRHVGDLHPARKLRAVYPLPRVNPPEVDRRPLRLTGTRPRDRAAGPPCRGDAVAGADTQT